MMKVPKEPIYLHNNQIKEIPKEIGNLTKLLILDLSDNQIKEIPKDITSKIGNFIHI